MGILRHTNAESLVYADSRVAASTLIAAVGWLTTAWLESLFCISSKASDGTDGHFLCLFKSLSRHMCCSIFSQKCFVFMPIGTSHSVTFCMHKRHLCTLGSLLSRALPHFLGMCDVIMSVAWELFHCPLYSSSINAVAWSLSGEFVVSVDKSRRAVLWSDI